MSAAQQSSARCADDALRACFASLGVSEPAELDWAGYGNLIESIDECGVIPHWPTRKRFKYEHPLSLQTSRFSVGKRYSVNLSYLDAGGPGEPVVAVGGLTNVAERFSFLALDGSPEIRLFSLDLPGRGSSGWLIEMSDYRLEAYVEQVRQFIDHMELDSCTMLGSSLGASAIMRFARRYPQRVRRIILNDSSPYIPAERRVRRAQAVARHYVFTSPSEMFRRTGAAAKHVGPVLDAVKLYSAHHKTRWSQEEQGRVYRHDLRALMAYRAEASESLDLWGDWACVECPVLLVHGAESDATCSDTIDRMREQGRLSVIHVKDVGHTPSLSDFALNRIIAEWVKDDAKFQQDRTHVIDYRPEPILYRQ